MAHHTATGPCVGMLRTSNMPSGIDLYHSALDDACLRSNPLNYVTLNMPPLITQSSQDDNTVPYQQSIILAEKIVEVCGEGRVRHDLFNGLGHSTLENATLPNGGGNNMAMIMAFIELHMKQ